MCIRDRVDTSWFAYDDQIQSALLALQGGIEGGLAAAELLVGDGNPCLLYTSRCV